MTPIAGAEVGYSNSVVTMAGDVDVAARRSTMVATSRVCRSTDIRRVPLSEVEAVTK